MSNQYNELLVLREDKIDNETNWFWFEIDDGAWDGPKKAISER